MIYFATTNSEANKNDITRSPGNQSINGSVMSERALKELKINYNALNSPYMSSSALQSPASALPCILNEKDGKIIKTAKKMK